MVEARPGLSADLWELGLPPLDLLGAGLASTLANCAMFLAGLWFATTRRPFRDYHVIAHVWHFDWPFMRHLIAIGIQISFIFLMEYRLFSTAAFLAA
ncbi:hypothetical protein [Bradyrhizobium australiense]|uniref:Uncharacterized protein n=1 Tax=Bradyrhizobium australiense TaxID=2721161 RepID=A0A7Y4LZT4_9BRAD|nr:hypothetical protein [Bradyrhizobium australiense]NOJ44656.1 hypothetical protein [Bradyrhizobium australiense]